MCIICYSSDWVVFYLSIGHVCIMVYDLSVNLHDRWRPVICWWWEAKLLTVVRSMRSIDVIEKTDMHGWSSGLWHFLPFPP